MEDFKKRYTFDVNKDLIGKGGFSKVYRAMDNYRKRPVALKFYYGIWSEKYDIISEINRMEDIIHPNLIRYYDATIIETIGALGDQERIQVGIMEYADAGDLTSVYSKNDPILFKKLILDILEGLKYLHQKGIAHRDMKPKNILLSHALEDFGLVAKIADFGISKKVGIEETGASTQLLGSIEYMAPEQFNTRRFGIDNKLHTNVDLWALGVIVYEMLVHQTPFGTRSTGFSNEDILNNIVFADLKIDYSKLEEPFRTIVQRCLVKNAAERVKTADELIALLKGKTPITAPPPVVPTPPAEKMPPAVVSKPAAPQETVVISKVPSAPPATTVPKVAAESTNDKATRILERVNAGLPSQKSGHSQPTSPALPSDIFSGSTYIPPTPKYNPNNGRHNPTLESGKEYFKRRDYVHSFQYLNSVAENTLDTESKFYKGFMFYNGKCGGAHDPLHGRRLMDEAKSEDRALVVDLMVKYVLTDYR